MQLKLERDFSIEQPESTLTDEQEEFKKMEDNAKLYIKLTELIEIYKGRV